MSPEERHRCMAAIKGKNTKPEMMVRRYLHALGLRYGLHNSRLPGKPDIVLRRLKTVVFVNGCFWHGHDGCKHFRMPKGDSSPYWVQKITRNKERDLQNIAKLESLGWKVIVVWECELKNKEQRLARLYALGRQLLEIRDGAVPEYIPPDFPDESPTVTPAAYMHPSDDELPLAAEPDPTYK